MDFESVEDDGNRQVRSRRRMQTCLLVFLLLFFMDARTPQEKRNAAQKNLNVEDNKTTKATVDEVRERLKNVPSDGSHALRRYSTLKGTWMQADTQDMQTVIPAMAKGKDLKNKNLLAAIISKASEGVFGGTMEAAEVETRGDPQVSIVHGSLDLTSVFLAKKSAPLRFDGLFFHKYGRMSAIVGLKGDPPLKVMWGPASDNTDKTMGEALQNTAASTSGKSVNGLLASEEDAIVPGSSNNSSSNISSSAWAEDDPNDGGGKGRTGGKREMLELWAEDENSGFAGLATATATNVNANAGVGSKSERYRQRQRRSRGLKGGGAGLGPSHHTEIHSDEAIHREETVARFSEMSQETAIVAAGTRDENGKKEGGREGRFGRESSDGSFLFDHNRDRSHERDAPPLSFPVLQPISGGGNNGVSPNEAPPSPAAAMETAGSNTKLDAASVAVVGEKEDGTTKKGKTSSLPLGVNTVEEKNEEVNKEVEDEIKPKSLVAPEAGLKSESGLLRMEDFPVTVLPGLAVVPEGNESGTLPSQPSNKQEKLDCLFMMTLQLEKSGGDIVKTGGRLPLADKMTGELVGIDCDFSAKIKIEFSEKTIGTGPSETLSYSAVLTMVCVLQICLLVCRVGIMLVQRRYGRNFMVPSQFQPPKFDYHRPIPPELSQQAGTETAGGQDSAEGRDLEAGNCLECAICYAAVESALEDYMLTPCDHVFHQGCLTRWMGIKMECPTCRRQLPPPLD